MKVSTMASDKHRVSGSKDEMRKRCWEDKCHSRGGTRALQRFRHNSAFKEPRLQGESFPSKMVKIIIMS